MSSVNDNDTKVSLKNYVVCHLQTILCLYVRAKRNIQWERIGVCETVEK